MAISILKQNLEKIIKERNLQIVDLERKAGLKKNNVYNIVKGISKNPSAQNIQAIADTLGVSIQSLYSETKNKNEFLNKEKLDLITKVAAIIAEEVINLNIKITYQEYIDLLGKIFEYNNLSGSKDWGESDYRFAQWLLLNLKK